MLSLCAAGIFLAAFFALRRRAVRTALLLIFLALFAVGFVLAGRAAARSQRFSMPLDTGAFHRCEGIVQGDSMRRSWGARVDVRLARCEEAGAWQEASGAVRLSVLHGGAALSPGERIAFRARFRTPREYGNPGSFPARRYLLTQGIAAEGVVRGRVRVIGAGRGGLFGTIDRWRGEIAAAIAAGSELPERALLEALSLGRRDAIPQSLREAFADAGLAHLLAISGLHVGFAAALFYLLVRLLLLATPRLVERHTTQRLAALVTLPGVWGYVLVTGAALSAVRAGIMITVFLVGLLLLRRQHLPSTLAAAVAIILAIWPLAILQLSFQLSVVAVLGIVLVLPPLLRRYDACVFRGGLVRRLLRALVTLVLVSFAATLFTAPIVAHAFHRISLAGIVANVAAVPLTGLVLVPLVGFASVASILLPAIAAPLWGLAAHAAALLAALAEWAASWRGLFVLRWSPGVLELLVAYAVIACVVFWRHLPYRRAIAATLIAALLGMGAIGMVFGDRQLAVTFLDVRQGMATLVRFPSGGTMLIDGGGRRTGSFDVGAAVVAPALWRLGVDRVDTLLLTHPHHDHYRGLAFIAERFAPKRLLMGGGKAPEEERAQWEEFSRRVRAAGVPVEIVPTGWSEHEAGEATLRLFRPSAAAGDDPNEESIIVDLRFGARRLLLMSDLTSSGEEGLLAEGADLSADLLQVGHHGAADASSADFLAAVRPAEAVISVGSDNPYGVPDPETLARLANAGATIHRTDRDGAITATIDGTQFSVSTMR